MKIFNFGSLNYDMVYDVEHFAQAGETISSTSFHQFCGGKGLNQSIALARASVPVNHIGKVGADGAGLLRLLEENHVDTSLILTGDSHTGHAIIQVDQTGQNCILLFGGANKDLSVADIDKLMQQCAQEDFILLQNEISNLHYVIDKAYEKGMHIVLNPSPIDSIIDAVDFNRISYLLLNEIEGAHLAKTEKPDKIISNLLERFPNLKIVLTLGKNGVCYANAESKYFHGIFDVEVQDTTAAGDTFTGYFIGQIYNGISPQQAIRMASAASALAVTVKGTSNSIPYLKDVETFLSNQ